MDSPDPPAPPDYTATAEAQGELNQAAQNQALYASRPTQITPWGRTDWTTGSAIDPATGEPVTTWAQNQQLDPAAESALYQQILGGSFRSNLANAPELTGQVTEQMGSPLDYDQFRGVSEVDPNQDLRQRAEEQAYGRATSRLDPRFAQSSQQLEIDLRNKGLRPGDEAYDAEMGNYERARNDAYAIAEQDATAAGRAESALDFSQQQSQQAQSAMLRDQEIRERLGERALPLQTMNMLTAGQGVQPAAMPNVGYSGAATPANLMGAAQNTYGAQADVYNARQAQRQGMFGGLMGLGSLGLQAAGMFG